MEEKKELMEIKNSLDYACEYISSLIEKEEEEEKLSGVLHAVECGDLRRIMEFFTADVKISKDFCKKVISVANELDKDDIVKHVNMYRSGELQTETEELYESETGTDFGEVV
ncbi:MAG: hypothetical protein AMJ43_07825 [Coxiella sp. DG_40]|nr:MAG: hypothetical protein AMJ43_07825 [Coxiella sp. DG_40]